MDQKLLPVPFELEEIVELTGRLERAKKPDPQDISRLRQLAVKMPGTRLVYVADREADMIALFMRSQDLGTPADWLVRAKSNRNLPDGKKLWASTVAGAALGEIQFVIASREKQKARKVRQQVWAKQVELPAGPGKTVKATCLIAREIDPPAGVEAIEWRLLTNCVATTIGDAIELIDWYRARWEIETFFHVLKNGCRVEALQLGSIGTIELALAVYRVVAWRLARLVRTARTQPDLDASSLFTNEECQAAYVLAKKPIPKSPPTLREVIRQIAMLGGFLGRKGDGEPGVKTLWQGLARVRDFVHGIEFMRAAHAL